MLVRCIRLQFDLDRTYACLATGQILSRQASHDRPLLTLPLTLSLPFLTGASVRRFVVTAGITAVFLGTIGLVVDIRPREWDVG